MTVLISIYHMMISCKLEKTGYHLIHVVMSLQLRIYDYGRIGEIQRRSGSSCHSSQRVSINKYFDLYINIYLF